MLTMHWVVGRAFKKSFLTAFQFQLISVGSWRKKRSIHREGQKGKLLDVSSFLSMGLFKQRPDSHLVLLMSTRFIVLEINVPGCYKC